MQKNQPQSRSPRRYLDARGQRRDRSEEERHTRAVRADAGARRDLESPTSPEELEEERSPSPSQGREERQARDRRDREELGRPPLEEQERALQEDVVERREREAAENE